MLKIEFLLTLVTLVYLLGYTFFPNRIHVDKYTLSLLAMLFLLAILPTLSSGSISYLFSFKRSLKLAENAMKRITGNDKTVGKNESKISADERGPFFTTTQVKENLRQELVRLQKAKLPKEEFIQPSDPLRLAVHLKYKAVVDEPLFEAIEKVINLCDVVDYDSKLTPQEVQQLVAICIPLFNNLASV